LPIAEQIAVIIPVIGYTVNLGQPVDRARRALKRPAISNESLINQAGRLAEPVSNRLAPVSANGRKRTIGVQVKK